MIFLLCINNCITVHTLSTGDACTDTVHLCETAATHKSIPTEEDGSTVPEIVQEVAEVEQLQEEYKVLMQENNFYSNDINKQLKSTLT